MVCASLGGAVGRSRRAVPSGELSSSGARRLCAAVRKVPFVDGVCRGHNGLLLMCCRGAPRAPDPGYPSRRRGGRIWLADPLIRHLWWVLAQGNMVAEARDLRQLQAEAAAGVVAMLATAHVRLAPSWRLAPLLSPRAPCRPAPPPSLAHG